MRIGVDIGLSKSPDAAMMGGLGYEYTWAWDMGTVASADDYTNEANFDTVTPQYAGTNGVGLRVADGTTATQAISFTEANINNSTHSNGTGGIPDGSIPQTEQGSGSRNEDHPGRFLSWVVTFDSISLPGGTTYGDFLGFLMNTQNGGTVIQLTALPPDHEIAHVNGEAVSGWGSQADYNALLGKITTITYDLVDAWATTGAGDDPTTLNFYPAYGTLGEAIDYDITIHGVIFSSTVPTITSLPVHTSSPSI